MSRTTIHKALEELETPPLPVGHARQPGGGRKRLSAQDPAILTALEELIAPVTRGHPESPLRWTCKGTRQLTKALSQQGYVVAHRTVADLLRQLGYSLQANAKTIEGQQHADRDAQFQYINRLSKRHLRRKSPAISVDTKKKELVGKYKNGGQEWQPKGPPESVQTHDFPDPKVGKAIPYGVSHASQNVFFAPTP